MLLGPGYKYSYLLTYDVEFRPGSLAKASLSTRISGSTGSSNYVVIICLLRTVALLAADILALVGLRCVVAVAQKLQGITTWSDVDYNALNKPSHCIKMLSNDVNKNTSAVNSV